MTILHLSYRSGNPGGVDLGVDCATRLATDYAH